MLFRIKEALKYSSHLQCFEKDGQRPQTKAQTNMLCWMRLKWISSTMSE